jgi:hypothetical protein
MVTAAEAPDDRRLVRQFRKGPFHETEGLTVFARSIGTWIDNDSLEDAHILGTPLRRLAIQPSPRRLRVKLPVRIPRIAQAT